MGYGSTRNRLLFGDRDMIFWLAVGMLIVATLVCGYYLSCCGLGRTPTYDPARTPVTRFVVLIPAHDEAASVGATVHSVRSADYPHPVTVVVVADNCSDDTAAVARAAGAVVLERHDPSRRGKGYALAFAIPQLPAADAVVFLDADSRATPDLLRRFDAGLADGTLVIQSAICTRSADGPTGLVTAVGNAFDNSMAAGRDRLGLAVPLRGYGMCFRPAVFAAHPWDAFGLTEDAEYARRLGRAGIRIRFDAGAVVWSDAPPAPADLYQQRRRWRTALFGGWGAVIRWVDSKPLVLAQLALAGLAAAASGHWELLAWWVAVVMATGGLYARVIGGVARLRGTDVWKATAVVGRLVVVTAVGAVRRDREWVRTRRTVAS
jgi:1,2-diacylglycerol 3-beta-glucosyltransferase